MNIEINKVKIFVTVPIIDVDKIRNAVCNEGAGIIGNYNYCTSCCNVIGTFKPKEDARPYIGEINKLEFVDEVKIEFVCEVDKVRKVIKVLRDVHPYEEPAIDIIPLIDEGWFKEK